MQTLVSDEVQFHIRSDGIYMQQMDEARVGLTVMFVPRHYFKELRAGSANQLRLQVTEVNAILSKLTHGDTINFSFKEGRLHIEIQGKRKRGFNLFPLEPVELERRVPKIIPTVKLKTSMEGLLICVEDVNNFIMKDKKKRKESTGQIDIATIPVGLRLKASTEDGLYSTNSELNKGWDIMQQTGEYGQRTAISTAYLVDVVKSISNITNMVQIEFTTDFPLHIIAELPLKGAKLEFWLAPRIDVTKAVQYTGGENK